MSGNAIAALIFWLPILVYVIWRILFTQPGQMNDEHRNY